VAVPGALILGPLNVRHALGTSVDSLPGQTAKASALYGLLGLFLLVFPFGLLVQFGWVGIVADVATVSVTVPLLARSRVLANAETERRAARLRLQQALR
jgi:hypothetical protein